MKNETIKLAADILAELTPTSPEWERRAAYNHLLRLRNSRDHFAENLAKYTEMGDTTGIRMSQASVTRLDGEIAAAEAKLIECGALDGRTQADVTPESIAAFFDGITARLDAEAEVSPAAQALASSWQPKTAREYIESECAKLDARRALAANA